MPLLQITKIVILGEGGVGKTTLLKRYTEGIFVPDTKITVGAQFITTTLKNKNGEEFQAQIWDFAGEKKFRFLLPNFCRGAKVAAYLAGLEMVELIEESFAEWIQLVKQAAGNIPIQYRASLDLVRSAMDHSRT